MIMNKLNTSAGHPKACCRHFQHPCQHNHDTQKNQQMQIQIQSARQHNNSNSNSINKPGYSTFREQRQSSSNSSLNDSTKSKSKNKCNCNCNCDRNYGAYNCKSSCKSIILQTCQCPGADRRNVQQNCNRSCSRQKILQNKIQHMLKKQQLKLVQINTTHNKIKFAHKPKQSNCLQQNQNYCIQNKQLSTPVSQNYCYYSQLQFQPLDSQKSKIRKQNCYDVDYNVAEKQQGIYANKNKISSKNKNKNMEKYEELGEYQRQQNKENNSYNNRHSNANIYQNQNIREANKNSSSYHKFDPLKSNKLSLRHYLNQTPQKQHKPSPFMNQIPLINQSQSLSRSINKSINKSKSINSNKNSQQQQQYLNTKNNTVLKQVRQLKGIFMQFINQKSQAKTRRKTSNYAKQFKDLIQQQKQTFTLP